MEQYERKVVDCLRKWLIEENLDMPMGDSGYRIRAEGVALETSEREDMVAILFRIEGEHSLMGFRTSAMGSVESLNPEGPCYDPPEVCAEVVLVNLDEAILTGSRNEPDAEGIAWIL